MPARKQKDVLDQRYRELSSTGGTTVTRAELDRMMARFEGDGRTVTVIGPEAVKKRSLRVVGGKGSTV